MKMRSLLMLTFIMAMLSSHAQIQKGDVLLGAFIGVNTNTYSGGSSSNAGISPRIGVVIGTNWVLGARLSAGVSNTKSETIDSKTTTTNLGATVFVRKYMPVKNKLGWYAELGAGVGAVNGKTTNSGIENKQNAFSYNAGFIPGVYYHATPKILLSVDAGGIGYFHSKNKNNVTTTSKTSSFGLNFLSSFSFGIDLVL